MPSFTWPSGCLRYLAFKIQEKIFILCLIAWDDGYLEICTKVTGKPVSCLFCAGNWLVINFPVLDNVCKQLPLKFSAGQVRKMWTRVWGKGEYVERLVLGMVWRWLMSLLVLRVLKMSTVKKWLRVVMCYSAKSLYGWVFVQHRKQCSIPLITYSQLLYLDA